MRHRAGGENGTTRCADTEWPAFSIAAAGRTRVRRSSRHSAPPRSGVCASRMRWSAPRRKRTSPLPEDVRRYYFPGVAHGGGQGGFSVTSSAVTTALGGCELMSNPAPSAPMRSALLKAFTDWVTKGTPMPPGKYPRVADGTLVPPTSAAMGFPKIPGRPSPDGVLHPLLDYDVGSGVQLSRSVRHRLPES